QRERRHGAETGRRGRARLSPGGKPGARRAASDRDGPLPLGTCPRRKRAVARHPERPALGLLLRAFFNVARASSSTGRISRSLERFAAFLLAMMRASDRTRTFVLPTRMSALSRDSRSNEPSPSIRRTMSKRATLFPANSGGVEAVGGT